MIKKIIKYLITFFISIYDIFIGFISPLCIMFIFYWFSNSPKGPGYAVPKDELGMYKFFALIILSFYIIFLSPTLYYIYKTRTNKELIIFQVLFIFLGVILFFLKYYFKIL